jgi:DNA-binding protein H-NS
MGKLIDIQSQIKKLQKQVNNIKSKEFASALHKIQAKMQAFGITVKDLQSIKGAKGGRGKAKTTLAKTPRAAKAPKTRKAGTTVATKYRGPNGECWSGRGLMPRWLCDLVAQGQRKEFFIFVASPLMH